MEGVAKVTSSEILTTLEAANDNWRDLEKQAPAASEALLAAEYPDFESLSAREKIEAIDSLVIVLASDNSNRFVARCLGALKGKLIAEAEKGRKLEQIAA